MNWVISDTVSWLSEDEDVVATFPRKDKNHKKLV
jgi:hypothetical protein